MRNHIIIILASVFLSFSLLLGETNSNQSLNQLENQLQERANLSEREAKNVSQEIRNHFQKRIKENKQYQINNDTIVEACKQAKNMKAEKETFILMAKGSCDAYNTSLNNGITQNESKRIAVQSCRKTLTIAMMDKSQKRQQETIKRQIKNEVQKQIQQHNQQRSHLQHSIMSRKEKSEARRGECRGTGFGRGKKQTGSGSSSGSESGDEKNGG